MVGSCSVCVWCIGREAANNTGQEMETDLRNGRQGLGAAEKECSLYQHLSWHGIRRKTYLYVPTR